MCGILFSAGCSYTETLARNACVVEFLNRRGPDSKHGREFANLRSLALHAPSEPAVPLTFYSSVLSLRGDEIVQQPLVDPQEGYLLCWNGEAWKIDGQPVKGNDTLVVRRGLSDAARKNANDLTLGVFESHFRKDHVAAFLASISGPFAVVFYDPVAAKVYFARDCLGRRSLLLRDDPDCFTLSSVSDGKSGWSEIDADGIYVLQLAGDAAGKDVSHRFLGQLGFFENMAIKISHVEWTEFGKIPSFNHALQIPLGEHLSSHSVPVQTLGQLLVDSTILRLESLTINQLTIPGFSDFVEGTNRSCTACDNEQSYQLKGTRPPQLAVLFSGGLDCSILARTIHGLLPLSEEIDLLNVAFENPRLQRQQKQNDRMESIYELCPDRITARKAFAELCRVCPGRVWRLVEIDVPYLETLEHRDTVLSLMYPHDTEMDRSIALALYFAARGRGTTTSNPDSVRTPYETSARVLFSGLGADELFGGYQRHATAFHNNGFDGLLDALELDITRLGKRNLGRDDRVIAHWGKEARYPFLDESLVDWAVKAPAWEKCGFGNEPLHVREPFAMTIEPGKQVLRLLALKLGMPGVACEKKRAIQFGARTAKMEGNSKGTQTVAKYP